MIGVILCCVLLYPMLICGCHFHAIAVAPTIVPIVWAIHLLASYRTATGRAGAWLTFGFAVLWLWLGIDSNLKFAFG